MMRQPRILTSGEWARLLVGLAIQPFLATVVAFLAFPWLLLDRSGRTIGGTLVSDPTQAAISVALGTGLFGFVVTFMAVSPTAVWFVRRHRLTLTQALLFGLGFANSPVLLGTVLTGDVNGLSGVLRRAAFASAIGVVGAAAFWWISERRQSSNAISMTIAPRD